MLRLPIELEIGLRYTRSKRRKTVGKRDGFLSFISGISTAGIALGVASLIVVLSVMNGFQKEVRDRMLSVLSHVEITAPDGLANWEPLALKVADRKSTRLNSSHQIISYAVFCLKKKKFTYKLCRHEMECTRRET